MMNGAPLLRVTAVVCVALAASRPAGAQHVDPEPVPDVEAGDRRGRSRS